MISKLPNWIWFGGGCLALIAGAVNAIGLLGFQHQAVSHMTGIVSLMGVSLSQQAWGKALHGSLTLIAFFSGAVLSNLIIKESTLQFGRHYGVALLVESLLLWGSIPFLIHQWPWGDYLISMACGLQNAMATTYSGAIIRTTHMTGVVTDLGILIGQWLRHQLRDYRKLRLYLTLLFGFTLGSFLGSLCFYRLGYYAMLLPATLTSVGGFSYITVKKKPY